MCEIFNDQAKTRNFFVTADDTLDATPSTKRASFFEEFQGKILRWNKQTAEATNCFWPFSLQPVGVENNL